MVDWTQTPPLVRAQSSRAGRHTVLRPGPETRTVLLSHMSGFWAFRQCGPSLPTAPQGWQDRVPKVGVSPAYPCSCSMPVIKASP